MIPTNSRCDFYYCSCYISMSNRQIPTTQKTITNCIGAYQRAMETDVFVFFVNFKEGDENGNVIMYRKDEKHLDLVSDNYFAHVGLMEEFREGNETWMSPQMKKARQLQIDEFIALVQELMKLSDRSDFGKRINELRDELNEFHVALPAKNQCDFLKEKFGL